MFFAGDNTVQTTEEMSAGKIMQRLSEIEGEEEETESEVVIPPSVLETKRTVYTLHSFIQSKGDNNDPSTSINMLGDLPFNNCLQNAQADKSHGQLLKIVGVLEIMRI
ncbi:hypothetical protein PoB_006847600 [Plakobranchus ocellatus]|uniref:Uncharacterized protein n=1 Tax=Plakobranchus ocellatus TaxID=259542 RepID=A0AAV4DDM4_9GAST|nr:hypothetical protein PoB_006847600 [Plakobranchus ocellatus]